MFGNKNSRIHKVQILCFLVFALSNQSAISAPNTPAKPTLDTSKKKVDLMALYQKVQTAPSFPDLPVFPGQTIFMGGHYMPEQNGIAICQMRYLAKEDPQQVISFYKDAFSDNGWKVLNCSSNHLIARHKSNHMCSVNVSESKIPKTKSQFTIAYRQVNRTR